jgi:hypothetical protein
MQCQLKVIKMPSFMTFDSAAAAFRINPQSLTVKKSYTVKLSLTDKISNPVEHEFKVHVISDKDVSKKESNNTSSQVQMRISKVTRD